jgi:hypothetical protein
VWEHKEVGSLSAAPEAEAEVLDSEMDGLDQHGWRMSEGGKGCSMEVRAVDARFKGGTQMQGARSILDGNVAERKCGWAAWFACRSSG